VKSEVENSFQHNHIVTKVGRKRHPNSFPRVSPFFPSLRLIPIFDDHRVDVMPLECVLEHGLGYGPSAKRAADASDGGKGTEFLRSHRDVEAASQLQKKKERKRKSRAGE
tara:strand:- start:183 stop:512 length:330 start_codon:yes stop_codon:yes gene_type:complete